MIELMIVLIIIGVMLAVVSPTLGGYNEGNKLKAATREVIALSKIARSESVFGARDTSMFFDLDSQEYWLDLRTPDKKTGVVDPKRKRTQAEEKRQLTGTIKLDAIDALPECVVNGKLVAIDFHPDGTATPTMLTLRNKNSQRMTVEFLRSNGSAELTLGTIEDKKQKKAETMSSAAQPPSSGGASGR